MTGHVFHPGHEELHGVTVVVEGNAGLTYVGRYHEQTPRGVLLHDVAVHDAGSSDHSVPSWLRRLAKFGIQIDRKSAVVPLEELIRVVRLTDLLETLP